MRPLRSGGLLCARGGRYRLLSGATIAVRTLSRSQRLFLEWLSARAAEGESAQALLPAVTGPGAFPLFGKGVVDPDVRKSPLFRVAEDLLARRASTEEGGSRWAASRISDPPLLSVTEAAERLSLSRMGVVKAIQTGRLAAHPMG